MRPIEVRFLGKGLPYAATQEAQKRAADAVRDGDRVLGVLSDLRVTNAGRGSALRPSVEAEVRCLTDDGRATVPAEVASRVAFSRAW
ncbi:MAG: hypothetical protein OSB21_14485, partial [Myxococcota bacterium]|nr:hypothetical protein [Myxococcota bacterium]